MFTCWHFSIPWRSLNLQLMENTFVDLVKLCYVFFLEICLLLFVFSLCLFQYSNAWQCQHDPWEWPCSGRTFPFLILCLLTLNFLFCCSLLCYPVLIFNGWLHIYFCFRLMIFMWKWNGNFQVGVSLWLKNELK